MHVPDTFSAALLQRVKQLLTISMSGTGCLSCHVLCTKHDSQSNAALLCLTGGSRLLLKVQCAAGGTPRFVAENKQALCSLMQLHPLNLTKADHATVSQPPSPNPLLDTNPFGAVPLSALVHLPTDSPKKKPFAGAVSNGGHFGAALNDFVHTPKGPARGEDEDVHGAPQPALFLRQAAVPAASFTEMVKLQVSLCAVVHIWMASVYPTAACCASFLKGTCLFHS